MKILKYLQSMFILSVILGISIFVFGCSEKSDTNTNNEITKIELSEPIKSPEDVIKDSFKYENEHNKEKLLNYYTTRYENINFRLDNLESIELNSLDLITDEEIYYSYFTSGLGLFNSVKRENVKKYTVNYNIKYKDQSKEPADSGSYDKIYTLIKENNLGDWKIDGIGEF
ncbi:DUF4829 domain-containing protein [Clostridium uliginosum]|uniref:DUF4829 domain-containing protein n=1 Tax=Clostridium uliginosum TaxID=119641 RepID=A0A1I1RCJ8_9CLOT|nr:DUF4829 domain-containing protein [Clostridium uliginosum]SFD31972.1 protein of unknown function [Clostridium uliginosum]